MAALERLTYSPSVGLRETPFSAAEYDKNGAVLAPPTEPTVIVCAMGLTCHWVDVVGAVGGRVDFDAVRVVCGIGRECGSEEWGAF